MTTSTRHPVSVFIASLLLGATLHAQDPTPSARSLNSWLEPQEWTRDVDAPVISLGESGQFDDMHVLSPMVAREGDQFSLWYSGSRSKVSERVFRLGLATSTDGKSFTKHASNPVFDFGDGHHSILTPTMLRQLDGTPVREDGKLRIWFSSTDFKDKSGLHTLHEATSTDGKQWSAPSPAQLDHVYAPTVVKDNTGTYRLWYTDVSKEPWIFRTATSKDGRAWQVVADPVMVIDQPWEQGRLFYPCVVQADGVFLMWYGSYWRDHKGNTAIGFAVSGDGITWHKHPQNPILRPEPTRSWESHYTTSQSVIRLPDGSWRIWYAARTAPPFVHKYFSVATARWPGLRSAD